MPVPGLLALERWQWFDQWTQRVETGGVFKTSPILGTSPEWEICNWTNASATARGTAEYRWPLSALAMSTSGAFEQLHTVHLRLQNQNNNGDSPQVGPATCVHSGGASNPGNCYFVRARFNSGTRYVGIGKFDAGVESTLVEVEADVEIGDVLSIGYRYDVGGGGGADLVALLNGVQIASVNDASGYDMGALSARPGVVGLDSLSIATSKQHGSAWSEWWVTDGYGSWAKLEDIAGDLTAQPIVQIYAGQRFASATSPRAKWVFSGEIRKLSWNYKRNGGCGRATITLQPQGWGEDLTARCFEEPLASDWEAEDWLAGDVTISVRYSGRAITESEQVEDTLYRGRISKVERDKSTGEIQIQCDGLIAALDHYTVWADKRESITIRTAIEGLLESYLVKSSTVDGPLSGHNILGLQSFLDQTISMDYELEGLRSVLDELIALLPDGMIYGVDPAGVFYVQQQVDHYTVDIASSAQLPIVTFDSGEALSFKRTLDLKSMRTTATVFGAEDEFNAEASFTARVAGGAAAAKALAMYGARHKIKTQDGIQDSGMAAKYAQAILKRICAPTLSVSMKVQQPIMDGQAFWTTLTPFMPVCAVRDRRDENLRYTYDPSSATRQVSDQLIRRFGDLAGWATAEKGSAGGVATWDSTAREQALDRSWMFHARLRFDAAHAGGSSTWAFLCGRPRGGGGNFRKGWGGVYWNGTSGNLEWWGEDNGGSLFTIQTGINVSTSTPAGAVVDLFVHRDSSGTWRFYSGATLSNTDSSGAAQGIVLANDSWGWRLFEDDGAGDEAWDGTIENVYLIDAAARTDGSQVVGIEAQRFGGAGFAARNAGTPLGRAEGYGLMMLAKLNEPTDPDGAATGEMVVWTDDGSASAPSKRTVSWTRGTGSTQGASLTGDLVRGYRLGEGAKRWGGPLVLYVDEVKYTVEPSSGVVTRELTLGGAKRSFTQSLASIEREVDRQRELIDRTEG